MKKWQRRVVKVILVFIGLYIFILGFLYFKQEKLLFHPDVLAKDYKFEFAGQFEEVYIPVDADVKLHGVLFKAKKPKGLVFYLHGNGGSVRGWGADTNVYTDLGYDLFIVDYRGYGKSGGSIENEAQLLEDVSKAYKYVLKKYNFKESNTIIAGYSIGTGPATFLAQNKNIKALILQAPYYSLTSLIDENVLFVPEFIKRYKLKTFENIKKVTTPIYIFHGLDDTLIPFKHSVMLKRESAKTTLIPLPNVAHNGINSDELFRVKLQLILNN